MHSLFITGTDTGIGKTVVAGALLAAARAAGHDAAPMKPIQTGCSRSEGRWRAPDLDFCLNMAELKPDESTYADMAPYCFEPACSPHLAAWKAGVAISRKSILEALERLQARYEAVLVEGAGGVMVPIGNGSLMLDLMRDLGFPALVVASPRLGTLNHTLLTLRALRGEGIAVAGIVLVETDPGERGMIERDNETTLADLGSSPILGTVPFMTDLDSSGPATLALMEAGRTILSQLTLAGI